MLRLSGLLVASLLSLGLSQASFGTPFEGVPTVAAQGAPDPGGPGPYAVGVTRRTFTRPSSTTGQPRVLDTAIWYPATAAGGAMPKDDRLAAPVDAEPERDAGPFPVVAYSHGLGSGPERSLYFKTYLASHGFVVVSPPHPGSVAGDCPGSCSPTDPAVRQLLLDTAMNRPDDVKFAVDQVIGLSAGSDPLLLGLTDPSRIGLAGHSFGGGTVLRTMGLHPRFLAGLAMAPPNLEWVTEHVSKGTRPTMIMGGGLDNFTPVTVYASQQRLFGLLSPGIERWLVGFPRGGHASFLDQCPPQQDGCGPNDLPLSKAHALITRWGGAFLLRHVAGDERYAPLLEPALTGGDPDIQITFAPAGS